jgi:hypothetical protein
LRFGDYKIGCEGKIKKMKYRGYDERKKQWEFFEADTEEQATPEATGYDKVEKVEEEK